MDVSLGLGMLSLVFFATAACRVLSLPGKGCALPADLLFLIGLSVGLPLIAGDAVASLIDWLKQKRLPSWRTAVWAIIFMCLALAVLIPAMAPPSGDDWDSLAYHLAIPKLYLEHHGFYYIDFASHSNFPFLVEMLYTPALSLHSLAGAKMVHYLYGVLLVLAVVMLVRKHFTPRAAPLGALAIAGMPIVLWEATTAYIDLATALYTVLAVHLLLDYLDNSDRRALVGCGIAAGFAASTKMTGLALIPLLAIWLLADGFAYSRRIEWKRGLLYVGIALLVCSPWYLKTLVYTGNPVYPFFYSIFGGRDWTPELARNYAASQAEFGMGGGVANFLLLPWNLTFHWTEFCDRGQPWLIIGPMLLVAVPLLLLARWRKSGANNDDPSRLLFAPTRRKLIGLTLFLVAQLAIWFVLTQQSRYLIPALAILAVVIAGVAYTDERLRVTRIALHVTFAATALVGVWALTPFIRSAAPVVFGSETQSEYLSRTLPIYSVQIWINDNAPPHASVALFGDTRGFYLDRPYVWADCGHNKRFTRSFDSVDEFVRFLKSQGVGYAMVNFRNMPGPRDATATYKRVYESIAAGRFVPEYSDDDRAVGVYLIK